uniref:Inhibitor of growth protein N-terminal histone-binding domain-containing protein n=1 Tax=Plectus sambesii TaxID=2011161 RepID=A0A914VZX4_9BILA
MLYLEDFLEMIEQLPSELRDRSTEMRMLDLQVQRGIDQNNKVIADFFQQAPSLSQEQRDQWYMKIKEDFQKIRDQAEEKVSIADAMYSLVEKYHNRLTREVMHFKYELEADSPGITETIERKLQDAERANIATRRERKRKAKILEALQEARASAEMGQRASTSSSSSWNGQPAHNDPTLPPPPLKLPNIKRAQTFPKQLVDSRSASTASSANLAQKAAMGANGSSFDPLKASQVSPLALPSGASMPAFTGSESRHGRPRKLTSRVQEMLKDTMHRHERTSRPPTFST